MIGIATNEKRCAECGGHGVEFRGSGNDLQYKICSRYREAGHPTEEQIRERIAEQRGAHYPASGRFA